MTRELSQIGDSEGQRDLGVMSELSIVTHICGLALRKWRQGDEASVGHIENQRKKKRCGWWLEINKSCVHRTHPLSPSSLLKCKPDRSLEVAGPLKREGAESSSVMFI